MKPTLPSPFREISNKLNSSTSSNKNKLSALQLTAPGSEKRTVRFNDNNKPPVIRNQNRRQDSLFLDKSDDSASGNESYIEPRHKPARHEKFFFRAPEEMMESSESSSVTSSAPSTFSSPKKYLASPPVLVTRTPALPLTSHSAPVSIISTPLATPRSIATKENGENLSRLKSFKKLGRELSEKLENIKVVSPFKASASKSSLHNSVTNHNQTNPLANFSEDFLVDLADKIRALKNNNDFKSKRAYNKSILLNAEILQNLPSNSEFREPAMLKLLLANANERIANEDHEIDIEVNLNDPVFSKFVSSAADGAFIKQWNRDSTDVKTELRQHLNKVKPTFARDFENSNYYVKDEKGVLKKLTSIDEFIEFSKSESNPDLPMIISNIASQNLGNFIKNALFLRQDSNGISQSILKRRNGIPIMPLALVKASYVFSKNSNGSISIEYTSLISKEINGAKEIRAKEMVGNLNTVSIKNASLEIKMKVNVESDGQWTMLDPHVKAKGWG